jgi:hypothetical protein
MSSFSFALDWYELIEEPDPNAPKTEPGEPRPTRTRHLEYGKTIYCNTWADAQRQREWHLAHLDEWLPSNAIRDPGPFAPVVSEVTEDHRHLHVPPKGSST